MKKVLPIILLSTLLGIAARLIVPEPPATELAGREGPLLKVHFLDVGQGDCILLQTPDRRNILVDTGDPDSAEKVARYLIMNGVSRLDLVVMTHPHMDHIGGLPLILDNFGISCVLDAGMPHGSRTYKEILSSIGSRKIGYSVATERGTPHVSRDVKLEVMWPPTDYRPSNLNDISIVVRVEYGEISFLLMGDIQLDAEGRLLAARQDLESTVLKVAHHGGIDSTSNELLQVVQPEYAVISVGADNPYGHPHKKIVRRLNAIGAQVFRTDQQGTVVFTTDGTKVRVTAER